MSTLSISKVHSVFLNVPIHCNVNSPAGQNVGLVVLKEGKVSLAIFNKNVYHSKNHIQQGTLSLNV